MTWWSGAVRVPDGPAAHADHAILSGVAGLPADLVCTHVDRSAVVATTVMTVRLRGARAGTLIPVNGPPEGARAIRFPGQDRLTGVHPAAAVVELSEIDEVVGIGVPVSDGTPVDTRGFLRPIYQSGRLVLLVEPAAGGVLRPSEMEQPHQCCGGH